MTGLALAVTLVGVVALALAAVSWSLVRQVRRLNVEVETLQQRPEQVPAEPEPVSARDADELVIRPTPLGPVDVEPDPSGARVASVTLAGPLIKVAAFSHGVRRALTDDSRMRVAHAFRKELRRQHRIRRKRAESGPLRKVGWRP